MKLINLTPHNIRLYRNDQWMDFPASGMVARVSSESFGIGYIFPKEDIDLPVVRFMIPVYESCIGEVTNLPDETEGVGYLVSSMVAQAVKHRGDVFAPDTGSSAIRVQDGPNKGQILGVTRLLQYRD